MIRKLTGCGLVFLCCSLGAGGVCSFSVEGNPFQLKIEGARLFPGDIFRITIESAKPIHRAEASCDVGKVVFYSGSTNHKWYGLAGIDLETKSGHYFIHGTLSFEDGNSQEFVKRLVVLPKKFPVQRLKVDEKFVSLDTEDSKRAEEETQRLDGIWKTVSPEKVWQGRFLKPIVSELSSGFGRRRIVNNQPRSPHSGVDLKAPSGTPIRAANSGKVVLAEDLFFTGKTVVLDHGLGLYTYYSHGSRLLVQTGESVRQGQVIAEVGTTGRVTGPHLHWACRLSGARVDPMKLTSEMLEE